jgi:D-beta-D-heptose 7-phosphate kinase/D-beta-D-heptose 1-phosphate adenosyltransferase
MNVGTRVVGREELVSLVAERRSAGDTIVLANGCFDLFHVGHIRYLEVRKPPDIFLSSP